MLNGENGNMGSNKKNNKLYIALVVLLILSLGIRSLFDRQEFKLALDPQQSLDRILIEKGEQKMDLNYANGKWRSVNGKDIKPYSLSEFLKSCSQVSLEAPLSEKESKVLEPLFERHSTKVSIYDKGKLIYKIQVWYHQGKNYSKGEKDELIKVAQRGNSALNLENHLNANPSYWYRNVLIHLKPEEITQVFVDNLQEPEQTFEVLVGADQELTISGIKGMPVKGIDLQKAQDYLGFFQNIEYQAFNPKTFQLTGSSKSHVLRITNMNEMILEFSIYELIHSENKAPDNYRAGILRIAGDTVVAMYSQLDPILVELDYFLKN